VRPCVAIVVVLVSAGAAGLAAAQAADSPAVTRRASPAANFAAAPTKAAGAPAAAPAATGAWGPQRDALAPPLKPELLVCARVGGADDQGLTEVEVRGNRVAAAGRNFAVVLTLQDDGTIRTAASGNMAARQTDVRHGYPSILSARLGPITYGYKQVDPILKQPYLHGPGWRLWDWTMAQCQAATAPAAPFMADSEIVFAAAVPNGNLYAVGKCDGGNTCLRVHPKDINLPLEFPISHGGGKGTSSFAFEITPRGELVRQMVLRGFANAVAWDAWGRILVVGAGVVPKAQNDLGYPDGAGVLLADREWTRTLFSTHIGSHDGKASFWACAIDSASGLAALAGYVEGSDFEQVRPIQTAPGGGKDGLLVVLRLWEKAAPAMPGAAPAKPGPAPPAADGPAAGQPGA